MECTICPASSASVFSGLPEEKLRQLEQVQTTNVYKKHQIVFYEGNPALGIYCISEGKVKLYKTTEEGKQRILKISGVGALLGYASLFSGQNEQYTAEVIEDAHICFLEKNGFLAFLKKSPELAMAVLSRLSVETIKSHEQLLDQTFKSARRRLAEMLLSLRGSFGQKDKKGVRLNLSLTRDELSQAIGATMETTVRLLSEFKQEGIITEEDHKILILKSDELAALATPAF
ncbi:MAG: Crp/Fnr family transcriptional regulator [Candidatus Omnitrophica bacterium]|nr:Crp/Fnr family transcriptional regulator [Candidatus Omnitrophota bacterium]